MGRSQRKRRRKWRKESVVEDGANVCTQLVRWLEDQNCVLPVSIRWAYFSDTGRGLCATTDLQRDSLLVKLPKHTMITVHTVVQSCIGSWFRSADQSQAFSNQQVLAAFLLWEAHLGLNSWWAPYIYSLPGKYTTPLTLSKREKALLPKFVRDGVQEQEQSVSEAYRQLVAIVGKSSSLCEHCGKLPTDVFSFRSFTWAWNTVNTRAVYVKPTASTIKLRGANTLALAPFLDLFNHSCFTATTVEETADAYSLFSSDAWPSDSQVFISYGPHANYKLYIEYGFVVCNNPHDVVPVNVQEIDQVTNSAGKVGNRTFSKARNELIEQCRLTENLCFSSEGPSFTMQAYVFVTEVCDFDKRVLQQKIFTCGFTDVEKEVIRKVVVRVLCNKITECRQQMYAMLQLGRCSESFRAARILVSYHLQLLERVYENISV